MDDFLVRSSTDFIDNKDLAFSARYVVGYINLSYKDACPGTGDCTPVISIVRIGDDEKAYHSKCCVHWGVSAGIREPQLFCKPVIGGDYIYYIIRQVLTNWENPPPWDISHYFLWKTHLTTYRGTQDLPVKLYHQATGPWPDVDVESVDYILELEYDPYNAGHTQSIAYLQGRLFYIYGSGGTGIAYIWTDPPIQGSFSLAEILPEFTKVVSLDTDGIYLYALGYKSDIEGLWLIKLNIGLTKVDELVIFKGKLHTGSTYDAQFSFWDNVNNQFVIGIAPVAGREIDDGHGYGSIVYSPVDSSIKWWKNLYPTGIAVHTMPGLDTIYFLRKRDDTIGIHTTHGDYTGRDLDVSDLGGSTPFYMRGVQVKEIDVETSVQSKTCLVRSAEEQDNLFPDIPGPTQVPREQRFVV
jgi:hypothetical protein